MTIPTTVTAAPNPTPDEPAEAPVSVWATAQRAPAAQRGDKYLPDSTAHPAKMLPAVAAYAIAHYTQPGDLVADPMCGIGTTLVEAVRSGRRALGVEYEHRWATIAQANLDRARADGHTADAAVLHGDARHLATQIPAEYAGQVALVVTSPPYGPSAHGQVRPIPGKGVHKRDYRYGDTLDRGNLANIGHHRLLSGFTRILTGCARLLRPGGHIAITIRPWREHAELIDLPSQIEACGLRAGLVPIERCVALLARVTDTDLIARSSFFARNNILKHRATGLPLHTTAHEDVLIFQAPEPSGRVEHARARRPRHARVSRHAQANRNITTAPGAAPTRGTCQRGGATESTGEPSTRRSHPAA